MDFASSHIEWDAFPLARCSPNSNKDIPNLTPNEAVYADAPVFSGAKVGTLCKRNESTLTRNRLFLRGDFPPRRQSQAFLLKTMGRQHFSWVHVRVVLS